MVILLLRIDETFSPVAMLKFIRILLTITVNFDYGIWQMDVQAAFLNGQLDKDIYIVWLIANNQENMVRKLQRSIYRLKKAFRSQDIRFNETIKSNCGYSVLHASFQHIKRKYHLIMTRGNMIVVKISSAENLVDLFTKSLPQKIFLDVLFQ